MKINGFTYVRNGFKMGYPFMVSIESILPIVDKLIVVVGDSEDGTREAILNLKNDKITIIDSVWDDELRKNGSIFRQQTNLGINQVDIDSDWAIHIQADEVFHEDTRKKILEYIKLADKYDNVDGLLFPYYHFWGDYNHIRNTRRTHAHEIRAFKNNRQVGSYNDSQGFRIFKDGDIIGTKLNIIKTDIPIYHYSYTRNPELMSAKTNYFHRFWHSNDWINKNTQNKNFDFNNVDKLDEFNKPHPKYMAETIANKDWEFKYDSSKSNMKFKYKLLYLFEKRFKYRLFEYKNYKEVNI